MVIGGRLNAMNYLRNVETVRLLDDRVDNSPCTIPDYPTTIQGHAGAVLSNQLIVCGGLPCTGCNMTNECNLYRQNDEFWKPMTPMLFARSGHRMVTIDNVIYAVGGDDGYTFEAFVNGSWTHKHPLPKRLRHHCVVALNKSIGVIGGTETISLFNQIVSN